MLAPGPGPVLPRQCPQRRQRAKQKHFGVKAGQKPDHKEIGSAPLCGKLNYSAAPRKHFVVAIKTYGGSDNESPVVTLTNRPVGLSTTIRSPRGSLREI